MKRVGILVLAGIVALVLNVQSVSALPAFNKQFLESYKEAKIATAAKEAKCNVCHYGKSKKNHNDYGLTLKKFVTKDDYKKLKDNKEALKKKIEDAFKTCLKEKSTGGKTFGELIKAGELPGTPPADAE